MARTKVLDEEDRPVPTEEERKALEEEEMRRLPESVMAEQARSFGEALSRQKKVRVKVPVDPFPEVPGAKKADTVDVHINGYHWLIKRGVPVEVPQAVADLLAEAGYI